MTKRDCTASTADLKNIPYLYPVISSSKPLHVAEDDEDYDAAPMSDETLPWALKQAELKALRTAVSGQVGRFYCLANLLIQNEPVGRSQDDLPLIAHQIRNVASTLEDTVHAIVGPLIDPTVDDPEPGEDDIAE